MIEFPEAISISKQLNTAVSGKIIRSVLPPTKTHKFCWFNGEPESYGTLMSGHTFTRAEGFGGFVELMLDNGLKLCVNDGVNLRLSADGVLPGNYQLAILFDDGCALVFTVAMYGGIYLHDGSYDNMYYLKSRNAVSPLSPEFDEYFYRVLAESKPSISMKALLATEQRFPGIGNGVVQDILFNARLHPKTKLSSLEGRKAEKLLESVKSTLRSMTESGGRDTEKDLYGNAGSYITVMSKSSVPAICSGCGGGIVRETYLGGSVYYCPVCQVQGRA